jgi:hypothetical protein
LELEIWYFSGACELGAWCLVLSPISAASRWLCGEYYLSSTLTNKSFNAALASSLALASGVRLALAPLSNAETACKAKTKKTVPSLPFAE